MSIAEAFKKLDVKTQPSDIIYDTSYQYLKTKNFNDLKAFKTALVALINDNSYLKAEKLIEKIPDSLISDLSIEIGYIYYQLNKSKQLFSFSPKEGLDHIFAQQHYKLGNYNTCESLYSSFSHDINSDVISLLVNKKAVEFSILKKGDLNITHASPANIHSNLRHDDFNMNNLDIKDHDFLFNQALIELVRNKFGNSLGLLNKAEEICKQSYQDQDLITELLPIKLTQSYIYQLQGKIDESTQILNSLDTDDELSLFFIKNNLFSLSLPDVNINLIEKDLSYQSIINKFSLKLSKFQYQTIIKNQLLLKFATGTLSKVENQFINQYSADFPGDYSPLIYKILIKLEITFNDLFDSSNQKSISRKLSKYIKTRENNDNKDQINIIVALLILVQVNTKQNDFKDSIKFLNQYVLANFDEPKLIPGLIAALIQVLEKTDNKSGLDSLYAKLIEKFISTDTSIIEQDLNYYNFVKMIAFKSFDHDNSKNFLEKLFKIYPEDKLISAYLNKDNNKLYPVEDFIKSVNIEEVLNTNIEQLVPVKKTKKARPPKIVKKKSKPVFSKKTVIVPKEELQLDEERWIPLKLRSYYKPTKKDKKKSGGHQGALETTPVPTTPAATASSASKSKKKKKGSK